MKPAFIFAGFDGTTFPKFQTLEKIVTAAPAGVVSLRLICISNNI